MQAAWWGSEMAGRKMQFAAHPYSDDVVTAVKIIYGKEKRIQALILRRIFKDFADDGFTEGEILEAVEAFEKSEPETHSIAYFRGFARSYIRRKRNSVNKYAEIW